MALFPSRMQRVPFSWIPSEVACNLFVVSFALWTLCCHVAVLAASSLRYLLPAAVVALSLAIVAVVLYSRIPLERVSPDAPARSCERLPPTWLWVIRGGGLLAGLGGLLTYLYLDDALVWWWWSIVLLGCVTTLFLVEQPTTPSPATGRRLELMLWGVALTCSILALVVHRPDADDAFYVNLAVAAADHPEQELLRWDTLHGIAGLPIHLQVYRVDSYELLNGAISYVTGLPAILCFHWISAALAALLVPLAHAKLFRLLAPRYWLWAVVAVLVVQLAAGDPHRWYGNFSLVRIWQGKAIFLSVILPLIYAYALQFGLERRFRYWLLLAAAQIAAVGLTSSALWAGPAAATFALASVTSPKLPKIRTFLLGISSSGYVLVVAAVLRASMSRPESWVPATAAHAAGKAFVRVLGSSPLLGVSLGSVLVAWVFCSTPLARRFAAVVPLSALLLILNPYTTTWVRGNVTGSGWRTMWSLPIPILMSLIAVAPLRLEKGLILRWLGRIGCVLLLAGFTILVPPFSALSRKNGVWLGLPELKVPHPEYDAAAALNASVAPGSYVAGPDSVMTWVPTFHSHAYPLIVRHYLRPQRARLGGEDYAIRLAMRRFTTRARNPAVARRFRLGLARFQVKGVCLDTVAPLDEAHAILEETGFRKQVVVSHYEIWSRP